MVSSISSPQSKREKVGSTLNTLSTALIVHGYTFGNDGTRHHRFDHGQCSITWILDYYSYAAYYNDGKRKGGKQNPPRSKLSDLRIFRHRFPTPQFRVGGGELPLNHSSE